MTEPQVPGPRPAAHGLQTGGSAATPPAALKLEPDTLSVLAPGTPAQFNRGPVPHPSTAHPRVELPERVRLVVLFGGQSSEHDVSRVTAASVLGAIDRDRFEVRPVGITRDGRWLLAQDAERALATPGALELPDRLDVAGPEINPLPEARATGGATPTVFLPLLHGPNGEDGTIQGLLELAGAPYVGSGVLGSALAMDKAKAKEVFQLNALPQARYVSAHTSHVGPDFAEVVMAHLGLPVFVKPANLGSSVGVSKAATTGEMRRAIELALRHDDWVVIEEAIDGREIEVGVLGNDLPRASVPGEIVPTAEFYDYEDKYVTGTAKLVIPADLPAAVADEARELAVAAFWAVRAEGMARVDFFYEEGGRGLLLNEVNTIPGFTPVSMYPQLWAASGLPYGDLISELVRLALERHERRRVLLR